MEQRPAEPVDSAPEQRAGAQDIGSRADVLLGFGLSVHRSGCFRLRWRPQLPFFWTSPQNSHCLSGYGIVVPEIKTTRKFFFNFRSTPCDL